MAAQIMPASGTTAPVPVVSGMLHCHYSNKTHPCRKVLLTIFSISSTFGSLSIWLAAIMVGMAVTSSQSGVLVFKSSAIESKKLKSQLDAEKGVQAEYVQHLECEAKGETQLSNLPSKSCVRLAAKGASSELKAKMEKMTSKEQEDSVKEALLLPSHIAVRELLEFLPRSSKFMLEASAKPPLHCAVEGGDVRCIELVAQWYHTNGESQDKVDDYGRTPLHIAAQIGRVMLIKHLLAYTCNVNICDKEGQTPLHYASLAGNDHAVACLLTNGADSSLPNSKGVLPGHLAAYKGHLKVLKVLQKYHTGLDEVCDKGAAPADYARSAKQSAAAEYCEKEAGMKKSFFRLVWLARILGIPPRYLQTMIYYLSMGIAFAGYFIMPWMIALFNIMLVTLINCLVEMARGDSMPMYLRSRPGAFTWWGLLHSYHCVLVGVGYLVVVRHCIGPHGGEPLFWAFMLGGVIHMYHIFLVRVSDPGRVQNKPQDVLSLLECGSAGKPLIDFCSTCWVQRPPRAKHCKDCGFCVEVMDHHCSMYNGCVGRNNHGLFLFYMTFWFCSELVTIRYMLTVIVDGASRYGSLTEFVSTEGEDLAYMLLFCACYCFRDGFLTADQWSLHMYCCRTTNEFKNLRRYFEKVPQGKTVVGSSGGYINPYFEDLPSAFRRVQGSLAEVIPKFYNFQAMRLMFLLFLICLLLSDFFVFCVLFCILINFPMSALPALASPHIIHRLIPSKSPAYINAFMASIVISLAYGVLHGPMKAAGYV